VGISEAARLIFVLSEPDPVAQAVGARWGTLPSTGEHVDGVPIRALPSGALVLRRGVPHLHDEHVDRRLSERLRSAGPVLIFPSVHRSERNVPCLTVHALGNPGSTAEVGGRARTFVPTDARRMADALRRLAERSAEAGMSATFEATHHGPELDLPAFFAEIGYGDLAEPPPTAVRVLADVLPEIEGSVTDRIALAIGGGHYAPHFTDLALKRHWAFGHILSRHALAGLDSETAARALASTRGAEGIVGARAEDFGLPALAGLGPRLRDQASGLRRAGPTAGASGT
jgi:D-tyrosyl-tRNA(Tyr) deacylase